MGRKCLLSLFPQRCAGMPPDIRMVATTLIGFVEA
jgi:hypothetical protein